MTDMRPEHLRKVRTCTEKLHMAATSKAGTRGKLPNSVPNTKAYPPHALHVYPHESAVW